MITCFLKYIINPNKVKEFEAEYLGILDAKHKNVLNDLKAGKLTDEVTNTLEQVAKDLVLKYRK